MRMQFWIAWVLTVTILSATPVHAQSGTPATGSAGAASCTNVEPRDAAFFQGLVATPAAQMQQGTPASDAASATPTSFAMPEGDAADEAVVAEVAALYQQLISCLNAGDYLRAYALYSDDYLLRHLTEEALNSLAATPRPTEDAMSSTFGSVLDARLLADGRIAVLITTSNPQSGDIVLFAILRRNGDRLQIDEEQVVEVAASGAATPATG